jgi:predicted acylesterase/phospholipase RssA
MLRLAAGGRAVGGFVDELAATLDRFVQPWRLGRMIDLDRLSRVLDDLLQPSLCQPGVGGPVLEVGLTDATTGQPSYVDLTQMGVAHRQAALRATMAFPLLYSQRVAVNGVEYVDGGIADPLPLQRALSTGVEHVIAIVNKRPGRSGERAVGPAALALWAAPGVARTVKRLLLGNNPLGAQADRLLDLGFSGPVRLTRIAPSRPKQIVSKAEWSRSRLRQFEELGHQDAIGMVADLASPRSDSIGVTRPSAVRLAASFVAVSTRLQQRVGRPM